VIVTRLIPSSHFLICAFYSSSFILNHSTLRGVEGCMARTEYALAGRSIQPQLVNLVRVNALQFISDSFRDVNFPGYLQVLLMYVCVVRGEVRKVG
jgi:hypothetical protein